MSERILKISKLEFLERKKMLSSFFGKTFEGILFKEGYIKGRNIIKKIGISIDLKDKREIEKFRIEFLKNASNCLKEENLVIDGILKDKSAIIIGSIEIEFCSKPNCHFMRGILAKIYEIYYAERIICKEIECEGVNNKNCVFHIELTI